MGEFIEKITNWNDILIGILILSVFRWGDVLFFFKNSRKIKNVLIPQMGRYFTDAHFRTGEHTLRLRHFKLCYVF